MSAEPLNLAHAPRGVMAAVAVAILVGGGYFAVAMNQLMRAERIERTHLVEITNAFTMTFTEMRGADSPVPATFRRAGIEHFSSRASLSEETRVRADLRMPGVPGLEIRTVEDDPRSGRLLRKWRKRGWELAW